MALAISQLTQGGDPTNVAASGTYVTASITPTADALLLLGLILNASIATPTITGNGLTWTLVNEVDYNTAASPVDSLFVFRASGPSPSTGAVTITVADNVTNGNWKILEVTGQHASTPIPQSATDTQDSGGDGIVSPALAAFGSANNWTLLFTAADIVSGSFSYEASYVELGTPQATAETSSELTAVYLAGNDTTPTATFSATTRDIAAIALELAEASGFAPGSDASWHGRAPVRTLRRGRMLPSGVTHIRGPRAEAEARAYLQRRSRVFLTAA